MMIPLYSPISSSAHNSREQLFARSDADYNNGSTFKDLRSALHIGMVNEPDIII